MNRGKYIFAVYGKNADGIVEKCANTLYANHLILRDKGLIVYENQVYDTGLPKRPVSTDGVSLHFHGIVFPKYCSIDQLSEDREAVLCEIIRENAKDLRRIPYSIRNGSYVAIAVDHRARRFLAFTSFLNSIPFYYCQRDGCIIVSTDLELLAKALNLKYELNNGVYEYYACGTNISDSTAFSEVKGIPKGAYLEFKDGNIIIDYYYTMPTSISKLSFSEHVDKFAEMWEETLQSVHSEKYRYGLGLTGGIDSRLILAALPDRSKPLLFTGSHPDNPDVVLAKHITQGLGLKNHIIEDYSACDRVKGYAKYCAMSDNPYHCNSLLTHEQMLFRKEQKLVYEYSGLTDLLGGVHTYKDRKDPTDTLKRTLPTLHDKKITSDVMLRKLVWYGLRNQVYFSDIEIINRELCDSLLALQEQSIDKLVEQLGGKNTEKIFLERFRHIYKIFNLLQWNSLPARRYVEHVSPYMNIEMTDFSCRIPLHHRDSRRILLTYLKRYHADLSKYVLSGYILSANSPWVLYKLLSPFINAINHLGVKVPFLQWYIRNKPTGSTADDPVTYEMQRRVCQDSNIVQGTKLSLLFDKFSYDKIRLMRLYNIALMEKKMSMDEDSLYAYLSGLIDMIRYDQS
nr:hypothetical protein [Candidatus Cloacimonadota bacterium]